MQRLRERDWEGFFLNKWLLNTQMTKNDKENRILFHNKKHSTLLNL
jgi:hypothetical protein